MKINIIIFLFFVNLVWAFSTPEVHFDLFVYDPHGKVLEIKGIKILKNEIYVDGVKISNTEVSVKSKYISSLVKLEKSDKSFCPEGKYILRKMHNNSDSIESGCRNSKRFNDISNWFHKMRQDVVLK